MADETVKNRDDNEKLTAGAAFVKWLGPFGCFLFLALSITGTLVLFTSKGTPLPGYTASENSGYYEEHIMELYDEVSDTMIPLMDAPARCVVTDGRVQVFAAPDDIVQVRGYIIHYYDAELFIFTEE